MSGKYLLPIIFSLFLTSLSACLISRSQNSQVSLQELLQTNKINIVYFIDSNCPISQQMTKYIREISQGIDTALLSSQIMLQPPITKQELEHFVAKYEVNLPVNINTNHQWSQLLGAQITPEVFLYDAKGDLRYHGAINNLYADIGSKRPYPTQHFLQSNIDSLLLQKTLPFTHQPAVGCIIHHYDSKKHL